jgi:hypothetical protein
MHEDAGKLTNYFNTEIKNKKDEIAQKNRLSPEEFETLFNDLELQVQSLNNLFKKTKAKEITEITIYKETEPVKILMM